MGCSAHRSSCSRASWKGGGYLSLLPAGQWGGLCPACSQPGFEAEGANPLFNVRLRKFPSGSKVRFFSSDHNEYKQDWFVRSLCLLKQPWSDRKWVWGQEVAYFLRQKGAIEKNLRFRYMFSKLWEGLSPSELVAIFTLEFSNTDFSIQRLKNH